MSEDVVQWILEARGRVQRVGYRDFVEETANLLKVTGKVWNDKDDDQLVHLTAQGSEPALSKFVKLITGKHGLIDAFEVKKVAEKEADPVLIGYHQVRGEPLVELAEATGQGARALNMLIGLGTETLSVGKETLSVGKETLSVGKETLSVGKETLSVGKETLAAVKEGNKELLSVGKETLSVGRETLAAVKEGNKELLSVGKETLSVGRETLAAVKEGNKELLSVGKETLSAVQIGNSVLGKKIDGVAGAVREESRSNTQFRHELADAVGLLDSKYGSISKTLVKIDKDLQAQTRALVQVAREMSRTTRALSRAGQARSGGRKGSSHRSR